MHPVGALPSFTRSIAVGLCLLAASAPGAAQPNIVILITDDQGYGDLSAHGNPVVKTPHLDRLRSESIRFADFHAAPLCTPSRGQLMSGIDAMRNGAQTVSNGRDLLRRDLPSLPGLFAAAGYQCGLFGKWHLGDNYPYRPSDRGFHESVMFTASQITSAPEHWENSGYDDVFLHNNRREQYHGYITDVLFAESMKWMQAQQAAGRPFLCYLATHAPHVPHFVPARFRLPYENKLPSNLDAEKQADIARFFGMIANIDENIARLESFLRERSLRDNTIVIFLTDNGGTSGVPVFNAGMRGSKFSLTEGGHRVPCFFRWPAGKLIVPGDIPEPAQMQDILPTLLDLAGIRKPATASFDGISLAPRLRGEVNALPDRMLVVNYVNIRSKIPRKDDSAVLWQRWRLVQNKALYNLESDPGQKTDVASRHPEVIARMRSHLDRWWSQLEPQVNDLGAIVIGSEIEPVTKLAPQDRRDSLLDQRLQVLAGLPENGPWNLEAAREGDYEFELRRWPREVDVPLVAGLPERKHWDGVFPAGKALPIAAARVTIGDLNQSCLVAPADKSAVFTLRLPAGRTQLLASFLDASGRELCGAYYVYVRRK